MILSCASVLLLSACALAASDFTLKGDPCSKYDSCHSKSLDVRTCSCDSSCGDYGTCCHDAKSERGPPAFQCYDRRTAAPVFVKRSCAEDFRGHVGDVAACLEEDEDASDVKNNLLVTSHRTKVTYWNRHCASCNREVAEDLEFWNIEVHCPHREGVNRRLIERNLTFDDDKGQWGLEMEGEFLRCVVRYSPPSYIDEVKPCTPHLISSCPVDYPNEDVRKMCSQYYAERKLKGSNVRYKNIHCAICNHNDVRQLECPGMGGPEDDADEEDFRDTVEAVFTKGHWFQRIRGRVIQCNKGFSYDPFRGKCRRDELLDVLTEESLVHDSAAAVKRDGLAILATLALAFLLV